MKQLTPAEQLQQAIFRKMTFVQKMEQVGMLRDLAWALKKARVKSLHPEWSEQEVQNEVRKIFLYAVS